jgi:hypothetical protein
MCGTAPVLSRRQTEIFATGLVSTALFWDETQSDVYCAVRVILSLGNGFVMESIDLPGSTGFLRLCRASPFN